jgi:clan AA aspartic protease
MGRVVVAVTVENHDDLVRVADGLLPVADVRCVTIPDALVDTGAMYLSLPKRLIDQLGLRPERQKRMKTTNGSAIRTIYGVAKLKIRDRSATVEVAELPDDCPVLIGQLPLEAMDWVVDCANQRLIGNPAHGGEEMYESY